MTTKPFGLFCPTSKACEVLNPRWTIQILGELSTGSTRFNDIKRGLPGISPTLLAKRLKEMQQNGLVERIDDPASGVIDYIRTEKAVELDPILEGLARWAQRNVSVDVALEDRDADVLMWTLRNRIVVDALPPGRTVVRFNFSDATSPASTYWLVVRPGVPVELCAADPGFEVDLFIETGVSVMTGIYLGRMSYGREIDSGRFFMSGDKRLEKTIGRWLRLSMYAGVEGLAQAV
ncbi:helix-turn-helix transcriptional regulator [Ruegeria pomeroyi]|nr:helix-turn-helix transcriptional regulator [Ruegeria pomeroyi]